MSDEIEMMHKFSQMSDEDLAKVAAGKNDQVDTFFKSIDAFLYSLEHQCGVHKACGGGNIIDWREYIAQGKSFDGIAPFMCLGCEEGHETLEEFDRA